MATRNRNKKSLQSAKDRYFELMRDNVEKLQYLIENFQDEIDMSEKVGRNWADVGTAGHYNDQISEVHDSVFGLGEYGE